MHDWLRSQSWSPFRELEELQNRLSGFLARGLAKKEGRDTLSQWAPPVDITEDANEYLVKMELPEVRKEDLSVTVEHSVLTISGERRSEQEDKTRRFHRVERSYGLFTRSFSLPEDADAGQVRAEFRDGLLLVHVGKSEQAKPRSIDVQIN